MPLPRLNRWVWGAVFRVVGRCWLDWRVCWPSSWCPGSARQCRAKTCWGSRREAALAGSFLRKDLSFTRSKSRMKVMGWRPPSSLTRSTFGSRLLTAGCPLLLLFSSFPSGSSCPCGRAEWGSCVCGSSFKWLTSLYRYLAQQSFSSSPLSTASSQGEGLPLPLFSCSLRSLRFLTDQSMSFLILKVGRRFTAFASAPWTSDTLVFPWEPVRLLFEGASLSFPWRWFPAWRGRPFGGGSGRAVAHCFRGGWFCWRRLLGRRWRIVFWPSLDYIMQ